MEKFSIKALFILAVVLFVFANINAQTINRLPCIEKKFSIVVHIVKDSSKQGNNYGLFGFQSLAAIQISIQKSIDSLNAHFAPICVSFQVCDYQYVDNYWYLSIDKNIPQKVDEMRALYNAKDRINIYYVRSINSNNDFYYVEDTVTNVNSGGIVLNNVRNKMLIQAMGVYFGLSTTNQLPPELVNGSNSSTTGDEIIDTPADPYVKGDIVANYVDVNCKFISLKKDANSQYYTPIVGNAMSPYPDNCMCNSPYAFTSEQYKKMANTYLSNPVAW